jgi:hypothetical protein
MKSLTYVGPHDAVDVWCPDGRQVTVGRGETFETTDEHAKALLAQPSNWKAAKPQAKTGKEA